MATWILDDGSKSEVTPQNGKAFTLKELQDCVNGYIEAVYLPDDKIMIVNEEGKYLPGLRRNEEGTRLLATAGGIPGDCVLGNIVIITRREMGE